MLSVCIPASILDPPMALTYSATIFSGFKVVSAIKPAGRDTARIERASQTVRRSLISKRSVSTMRRETRRSLGTSHNQHYKVASLQTEQQSHFLSELIKGTGIEYGAPSLLLLTI